MASVSNFPSCVVGGGMKLMSEGPYPTTSGRVVTATIAVSKEASCVGVKEGGAAARDAHRRDLRGG